MNDEGLMLDLPMEEIMADHKFNCRGRVSPIDVVDLAKDIEKEGLIQPIVVSPTTEYPGYKYLLIAGYRRYTAHEVLKLPKIRAVVREGLDAQTAQFINLKENVLRKDLNVLQEANAIRRLHAFGLTEDDVAQQLGMSRGWVQVRFMLLELNEDLQRLAGQGILRQVDIRELYKMRNNHDRTVAYVKAVKDARMRGESAAKARTSTKKDVNRKKHRTRSDILSMNDYIYDLLGPSFATRTLAWAGGEISDLELLSTIKEQCDDAGINYTIPLDGNYGN